VHGAGNGSLAALINAVSSTDVGWGSDKIDLTRRLLYSNVHEHVLGTHKQCEWVTGTLSDFAGVSSVSALVVESAGMKLRVCLQRPDNLPSL
jgi:hypothetical protein